MPPIDSALEIEIATASRVGVDGVSVHSAAIDPTGELLIGLTDGRKIKAGWVGGEIQCKRNGALRNHPDMLLRTTAVPGL
ncbi:MAG: hypothetical protein LUD68_08980 [Rikenellaceae bacterium]|nr:hypothetical protein [Rikenellaceae bacterium]